MSLKLGMSTKYWSCARHASHEVRAGREPHAGLGSQAMGLCRSLERQMQDNIGQTLFCCKLLYAG